MSKRSSDQPKITRNQKTTAVELGTFKVTINALREAGRSERFRLNWWISGRRFTRNFASHEAAVACAKDVLAERVSGHSKISFIEDRKLEYVQQCEEQLGGTPIDVAVKFYLSHAPGAFVPSSGGRIHRPEGGAKGKSTLGSDGSLPLSAGRESVLQVLMISRRRRSLGFYTTKNGQIGPKQICSKQSA